MKKLIAQIKTNLISIIVGVIITVASVIVVSALSSFKEKNKNIDRIPAIEKESKQRDSIMVAECSANSKSQQIQIDNIRDTTMTLNQAMNRLIEDGKTDRKILLLLVSRTKGLEDIGKFIDNK